MAKHLYQTLGIIIGGQTSGEADKNFSIFTRDYGLLSVQGRGVRKIESKIRPQLLPWAVLDLALVPTRGGWRLTAVQIVDPPPSTTLNQRRQLEHLGSLLIKLLPPAKPEEKIFNGLKVLLRQIPNETESSSRPLLFLVATLRTLGYVGTEVKAIKTRAAAQALVQQALKISQLF